MTAPQQDLPAPVLDSARVQLHHALRLAEHDGSDLVSVPLSVGELRAVIEALRQRLVMTHPWRLVDGKMVRAQRTTVPDQFVTDAKGCHVWQGGFDPDGYGRCKVKGKQVRVHRALWIEKHGPIPKGLFVCHRCDNPACGNLEHLFLGTHKENMADMVHKGRGRNASVPLPPLRGQPLPPPPKEGDGI